MCSRWAKSVAHQIPRVNLPVLSIFWHPSPSVPGNSSRPLSSTKRASRRLFTTGLVQSPNIELLPGDGAIGALGDSLVALDILLVDRLDRLVQVPTNKIPEAFQPAVGMRRQTSDPTVIWTVVNSVRRTWQCPAVSVPTCRGPATGRPPLVGQGEAASHRGGTNAKPGTRKRVPEPLPDGLGSGLEMGWFDLRRVGFGKP